MSTISSHDREGNAHGEFAEYIDQCKLLDHGALGEPKRTFHSIRYDNESKDRLFTLRNCVVEGDEIRGQAFWMIWIDSTFKSIDFSHTRGIAHWTRLDFERINFHHLMADISAAQTIFTRCNFNNAVLQQPIFLQCKFVKCKFNGAIIAPVFIDCEFEDVDLKNSRWENPKILDIRGTWRNAEQLWETSSTKAKAFFLREPIETASDV